MRNIIFCISATIVLLLNSFVSNAQKPKIEWLTFEQAFELNKTNPKKIFIDVYTDWCGWCKKMDSNTFTDKQIVELMNKHFYAVKLNAEMKDTVKFKSYTFINPTPNESRSVHQLAASLLNGQMSYPTTVYLDEGFNMLNPVPGYMTPESLEPFLKFYGENIFKTQSWEDYSRSTD